MAFPNTLFVISLFASSSLSDAAIRGLQQAESTACPTGSDAMINNDDVPSLGRMGYVYDSNGNPTRGLEKKILTNGCTYDVRIPDQTELYLVIKRPTNTSRLVYNFAWKGEYQQPVTIFSWEGQCCSGKLVHPFIDLGGRQAAIYGDWAVKPPSWSDVLVWKTQQNGQDKYHCRPACRGFNSEPWGPGSPHEESEGLLYITISTWLSYGSVEGEFSFEFQEAKPLIKEDQLAALKDVYNECCWPTAQYMPDDWDWETHKQTTSGDTDEKPYCDWLADHDVSNVSWPFDEDDCEDIDYVFCDNDGNVEELDLSEFGLQCEFPDVLNALTGIRHLNLESNKFSGKLPAQVVDLPQLERIEVSRNMLTGSIPCPSSNNITILSVAANHMSGGISTCLGDMRKLENLDLSANLLTGTIPTELGRLSGLLELDLSQNMLTGTLPEEFGRLSDLAFFRASRNYITGFTPMLLNVLANLVQLDLSYCSFDGPLPSISAEMKKLRSIHLTSNHFNGSISEQFSQLMNIFQDGSASFAEGVELYMGSNDFSGPLPYELYEMVYSTAYSVQKIDLGGNHFRCDKATGSWPEWALRMEDSNTKREYSFMIGRCTPVPRIHSITPTKASPGQQVTVRGESFEPSQEAKCMLTLPDGTNIVTSSAFLSADTIFCLMPQDILAQGGVFKDTRLALTVANFGEDYYTEETVQDYVPVYVEVACADGYAGRVCEYSEVETCNGRGSVSDDGSCTCDDGFEGSDCGTSSKSIPKYAIALIAGLVIFIAAGCSFMVYLVHKERKGDPVFMQLAAPLLEHEKEAQEESEAPAGQDDPPEGFPLQEFQQVPEMCEEVRTDINRMTGSIEAARHDDLSEVKLDVDGASNA